MFMVFRHVAFINTQCSISVNLIAAPIGQRQAPVHEHTNAYKIRKRKRKKRFLISVAAVTFNSAALLFFFIAKKVLSVLLYS